MDIKSVTRSDGTTSYNVEIQAGLDQYRTMNSWCWKEFGFPLTWCCQHRHEIFDPPIGKDRVCQINYASFWFDDAADAMAFKLVWI